jgi:hypothetical protein
VVGGLPTTPDNVVIGEASIATLRELFMRHGHRFLVLPNHSQYPLSCFYDSLYHLNEECQIRHSALLGQVLAAELARNPVKAP